MPCANSELRLSNTFNRTEKMTQNMAAHNKRDLFQNGVQKEAGRETGLQVSGKLNGHKISHSWMSQTVAFIVFILDIAEQRKVKSELAQSFLFQCLKVVRFQSGAWEVPAQTFLAYREIAASHRSIHSRPR